MLPIHPDGQDQHRKRVQDVEEGLVAVKISIVNLGVLGQPEDRSYDDQAAGEIEVP